MLPFELVAEILARLPVKCLLRFRCVCKSWNALISDPQFAKKQFRTSATDTDTDPTHSTRHHHLILNPMSDSRLIDYSLPSLFNSSIAFASASHSQQRMCPSVAGSHQYIFGSCHGILCLLTASRCVLLWNPSTGKFKTLPSLEVQRCCIVTYGFGYDRFSDSYKVVAVFYTERYEFDVRVYTLVGTDSWRRIQHFPFSTTAYRPGIFVSGTLNWLDKNKNNLLSSRVIVSLDLGTETFQQLLPPDYGADVDSFVFILEVLKGSLCLLACRNLFTDVWVMKDYGNKESWTKLLVVPDLRYYPQFFDFDLEYPIFGAFCISDDDDEILLGLQLHMEQKFVVYNSKKDSFRTTGIQNFRSHVAAAVYVESLISPCF